MSEKWRNENWFTSSWNFAEEVRNSLHFSDHIKIHDVTLRDGEQQAGLIFDYKQKIALAEKLSEMGIHRIEAGMPAVSAQDRQVIVTWPSAAISKARSSPSRAAWWTM